MLASGISSSAVLLYAAVGVGIAVLLSVWMVRRRRSVWKQFAIRHGLRMQPDPETGKPIVYGTIGDRPFRLAHLPSSSDTGELGVEEMRMRLGLRVPPPEGLEITKADGVIGDAQRALEGDRIETGDPALDRYAVIRSDRPDRAIAWLTDGRKGALRKLLTADGAHDAGLRDSQIFIDDRQVISSMERLGDRLRRLQEAADELDGAESR